MDAFERIDEDRYSNTVSEKRNYMFFHIYGIQLISSIRLGKLFPLHRWFNLRKAINICLKENLKDTITSSFTWWGREGHRSLYDTRLVMAIWYEIGCICLHIHNIIVNILLYVSLTIMQFIF